MSDLVDQRGSAVEMLELNFNNLIYDFLEDALDWKHGRISW